MPQQRGLIDPKLYELRRRRNVTIVIFGTKRRGREKGVPGLGKASLVVRIRRDNSTLIVGDRRTSRKCRTRLGEKQTIPPAHRCERDTPTSTSVLYSLFYRGNHSLRRGAALIAGESTRG